jgi:hypothetical protein
MELRTIPAFLGIFFAIASLYQFGGISEVHLVWLDYTLTTQHAMFGSLGIYAVAFASSETRNFEYYEDWEKGVIAAGPALIVAHQYLPYVTDLFASNTPLVPVIGFIIALASWGAAVR